MMTIRVLYLALLVVGLGAEFAMTVEPQGAGSQHTDAYLSDQDLDVRASARATNGYWFHAGRRNLDPRVFGTVVAPFGTNPIAGVPLDKRLSDGQGNWTTTAAAIPVSNVTSALEPGSFASVSVRDRTPTDRPSFSSTTYDEVELEVVAITAEGLRVEITANTPLPRGPHHEFFGGVGTNVVQHGRTGIGIKLVPQVFSYLTVYAKGEIRVDGELLPGNDDQLIHLMVSQGTRDAANNPGAAGGNGPFLATDAEVNPDDLELLLVMPGTRFLPRPPVSQPIVGLDQGFIHLVFEDVTLAGSTINGTLKR
jgi:hypothetical protein